MSVSPDVAVVLARLEAMDRARELEREAQREWREDVRVQLREIVTQVKATNGRVTSLERDEARQDGERAGREGLGKAVALAAGAAAAATGVAFQIIDHIR